MRDLHESSRSCGTRFNSLSGAPGEISSSQTVMDHVGMSSQAVWEGSGGVGGMSPPKWIPKDKVPRTVSRMLTEKDGAGQTQERGVQVQLEKEQEKLKLTERIILELINDDSFMKEVRSSLPLPIVFRYGEGLMAG